MRKNIIRVYHIPYVHSLSNIMDVFFFQTIRNVQFLIDFYDDLKVDQLHIGFDVLQIW